MAIEATPGVEPTTEMMRTLPRAAYLSEDHFARETDRIFHREWFVVGRLEAIPAAGDFLHVEVAGESVLIVRTKSERLSAF
ncbi:MAG: aromatic ring-hydroxylating dioxygenase subunit alpha, partial [Actinomycetota bacterium]